MFLAFGMNDTCNVACQGTFEWKNSNFSSNRLFKMRDCFLSYKWLTSPQLWKSLVINFLPLGSKALVHFVPCSWIGWHNCDWFLFFLVCWSRSPERTCIWWEERWRKGDWRRRGRIRWAVYSAISEHFLSYCSNCSIHSNCMETSLYSRPCLLCK